jgi:hypothetical protein
LLGKFKGFGIGFALGSSCPFWLAFRPQIQIKLKLGLEIWLNNLFIVIQLKISDS